MRHGASLLVACLVISQALSPAACFLVVGKEPTHNTFEQYKIHQDGHHGAHPSSTFKIKSQVLRISSLRVQDPIKTTIIQRTSPVPNSRRLFTCRDTEQSQTATQLHTNQIPGMTSSSPLLFYYRPATVELYSHSSVNTVRTSENGVASQARQQRQKCKGKHSRKIIWGR